MNFKRLRHRSKRSSMSVIASSEKWRNYGKTVGRRTADNLNDYDSEDDNYDEIKDWVQQFFEAKSNSADRTDQDIEVKLTRKQTFILSTLVPDELLLLNDFTMSEPKKFVGVLLMADVSGYTSLSERYSNLGKGGTYRLTVTLNTYLGSLVELIYSHGGDILKFAGDAFLALWKTDKKTFLCHTIHNVIACALIIQHSYSTYETDVKVSLRVKLAISAGNIIFSPIGSGIDMNYVVSGLPVLEAKLAESVCASGEVKLTPNAWGHCYSRNYDHIIHDDGHVTIKSILYDPHDNDVNKPFAGFGALIKQVKRFNGVENIPDHLWNPPKSSPNTDYKKCETLSIRKNILMAEERNIGSEIRKFMIRPVLTQIDAHQPLEYLTEMRLVSILFMTLKPKECTFTQLITIVNNAYKITCEIAYKSMGCVNKIILFDKDVMILVVFGLRGFKHESEARAALKCSNTIKKSISSLDGVLEVSIGVTTGQVYCGVVGHPLRREFTVIGAIVNKAARLMCGFRSKITCDEATFVKSKLSANSFTLQPKTELKGINTPGKIYEYSEDIRVKEINNIPVTPPLLGHTEEMDYYKAWLENTNSREYDALLLVGEQGVGKSRTIKWMYRYAKNNNYSTCYITLSSIHSATPYLALTQIFEQILRIPEPITGFAKEEQIIKLLKMYDEDLCYLNNILKLRFAYHENIYLQNEAKRKEKAKYMFAKLIAAISHKHVVFLDDLHNLDEFSWEYISSTFCSMNIFTVGSATRGNFTSVPTWLYTLFINNRIRKIVLGPLEPELIPALACQMLDVRAVSKDLLDALTTKCNNFPGLIESFIIHLFSTGAIEFININEEELDRYENEHLQFPEADLLHPQAIDSTNQEKLNEFIESEDTGVIEICVVNCRQELNTNMNTQNFDTLVMIQIDSLTPYQQLLLKIASVIGNVFSRGLLESIMYENDWLITAKAIKRLFSMRILGCANVSLFNKWNRSVNSQPSMISGAMESSLICECNFEYDPDNDEKLPKYAFCKVMKFKNKSSRSTCYELLPINQKKEFHSRIVNYLEDNPQKCPHCGGNVMIVQSLTSLTRNGSVSSDNSFRSNGVNDSDEEYSDTEDDYITMYTTANIGATSTADVTNNRASQSGTSHLNISKPSHKTVIQSKSISDMGNAFYNKMKSQYQSILKSNNSDEFAIPIRQSTKRVTMTNMKLRPSTLDPKTDKVFDKLREVVDARVISDWHELGVKDSMDNVNTDRLGINKERKSFILNVDKGVSQTDFRNCTCADLNISIYEQLIYHSMQAELKNKAIQFMILFSYLNILSNNIDIVFPKLEEAEQMCSEITDTYQKKRWLARIHALRSASCLMAGKLTASKIELERALKLYKINLDKVSDFIRFNTLLKFLRVKPKNYVDQVIAMKSDSVFCLNVAILLNVTLGDDRRARCAAMRALQTINEVECPLIDVCDTYTNALQVEINRGMTEATAEIERMAYLTLKNLSRPVKAQELFAIGKLFMESFRVRTARAQMASAIRSGFRAITISRFLLATNVTLDIIPDLFYVLLSRRRIEEAIDVLHLTLRVDDYHVPLENETWYYALCIDMILDAGFQKENPQEISRFAEFSLFNGRPAGPSRRRLVVGLWTYWLRADSEKKAKRFEAEALSWATAEEDMGSLTTLLSAMRLAEGMLESLARKVDDLRKVVDLMELRSIAERELSSLEDDARVIRALYPRWLRLRALTWKLSGRLPTANNLLNQSLEEARRVRNHIELELTKAALTNTVFWTQNARNNCFMDWRLGVEHARTSWHQLMYRTSLTRQ